MEAEHEHLAIHEGGNVRTLPERLARAMLDNVGYTNDLAEEIEGEVAEKKDGKLWKPLCGLTPGDGCTE